MMKIKAGIFFIHCICCCVPGNAVITESTETGSQPNIKILSDRMDCEQERSICVASGNASAEKLDDSKEKLIKADRLSVHFSKQNRAGPLKVTLLEAEGSVIIFSGNIIVQGQRGNYTPETEIAEIFDNVKVTSGPNQLEGSYGKVNMKTQQYTLRRTGERVQALIFSQGKK